MSPTHAVITGVFGYVPDYVLTNGELETMVDTNDEWIRTRTGIEERRILKEPGKATSDLGVEAVKGLLEKTGTDPNDIELLICATVTPDMTFPDTANTICDKSGIQKAWAFDLNAACSGFLYALSTGAMFIRSGVHKKVVVVGADMMSSIIDYEDRATCVIFGDGAGAVLLEGSPENEGVLDSVFYGDGAGRQFLHMKAGGSLNPASHESVDQKAHFVFQDGRPVFKAAIKGMVDTIKEVLTKNNLAADDIRWLVPHQANKRIIDGVSRMLDFDEKKVMVNIQRYGNTTAGTLPLCLWDYENQIKKGDYLILTAFGGGFTWGSTLLKWAY